MVSSLPLDSIPPMAKPSVKPVKPSAKQKQGRLINLIKQAKTWDIGQWDFFFLSYLGWKIFSPILWALEEMLIKHHLSILQVLYLWTVHRYWVLYLWITYRYWVFDLCVIYYLQSSSFPPQSPTRLGGFSSDWILCLSFEAEVGESSDVM